MDAAVKILAILVAGAVLLSPAACTMRKQELIAQAIAKGSDPIAVKCALEDNSMSGSRDAMCLIRASQAAK